MDTLTQALLGGAVGYSVAGKVSTRKAVLWGAALAVLPDLDIFIPYSNDVAAMTYHRSWSHSWLVQTLLAPLLAMLISRFDDTFSRKRWWVLVWLALVTHSGLDALTVYGTQLFWPLMPPPIAGGSIFIIDPMYSLPLLAGVILILWRPYWQLSDRLIRYAFIFSCIYLCWGLAIQQAIMQQTKQALVKQGIVSEQIKVLATPFNSLLWRILIIDDHYYYEGFRSVFDGDNHYRWQRYDRGIDLASAAHLSALQRLAWFTNGFFKLEQETDKLIFADLRMGMEPHYFFRFELARWQQDQWFPLPANRSIHNQDRVRPLQWIYQRIFDPDINTYSSSQ